MQPTIIHGLDGRDYVVVDGMLFDVNSIAITLVNASAGLFQFCVEENITSQYRCYEFPYEEQATAARAEMIAKLEQIKKEIENA